MPLTVLWTSRLAADLLDPAAFASDVELRRAIDPATALEQADWAQVLVAGRADPRLLDGSELRHVVVPFAGIDPELLREVAARAHLTLHNSHFNAAFVAQHALALLLSCSNRVVEADRAWRSGDWRMRNHVDFDNIQLPGRRCLLLGYGAVGRALAPLVEALGMTVSVLRRGAPDAGDPVTYGTDQLHEALAATDVVIISLPGTEETDGLIDAAALAALPSHAILINVGRGSVVDPAALYRALMERRLHGAGLDVWWRYPPSGAGGTRPSTFQDLPFHTVPNLVASPHRANHAAGWQLASFRDVARTIDALARGESRNLVDVGRGY